MFSEPSKDSSEISKVIFKSFREDNNVIYISAYKVSLCSQNCVYDPLNVSNRIVISYYSTVKSFLSLITSYCKFILVLMSNSLLIEEYGIINSRDVRVTCNCGEDVGLRGNKVGVRHSNMIKSSNVYYYTAFFLPVTEILPYYKA